MDSNLRVTEEVMDMKWMHGTTSGKDIIENVCQSVTDMKLAWDKLIGLTADGAAAVCREKSGLVVRMRVKMQEENWTGELTADHCLIHQEALGGKVLKMDHGMSTVTQTLNFIWAKGLNHRQFGSFLQEIDAEFADVPDHPEVRWLSRGKVLNRGFELSSEICQFLDSKGKDSTVLRDEKWKCELVFLADIPAHLKALNLQLQGRDHMITDMDDAVKAFHMKLLWWETQMQQCNLPHFHCCQVMVNQVGTTVFPKTHFADKWSARLAEFAQRFSDFEAQKKSLEWLRDTAGLHSSSTPPLQQRPSSTYMQLQPCACVQKTEWFDWLLLKSTQFMYISRFCSMFIFLTCIIFTGDIFEENKI